MALNTFVQAVGGATTVAAPASVAPTWAAATAGTTLVVILGLATTGVPAIGAPAGGWQRLDLNGGAAPVVGIWFLPGVNNPGGSTGATWTLTNTNGAAWHMYELGNNVPSAGTCTDPPDTVNGSSVAVSSFTVPSITRHVMALTEFAACAVLTTASTYTFTGNGGSASWQTTVANQTSTTGATNVILAVRTLQQGCAPRLDASFSATLGVAAAYSAMWCAFLSTSSGAFGYGPSGPVANIDQGYAVTGTQ